MSNAGASLATCYGPVSTQMMAKAENIRLLILDVDGVLSDGLIYMGNNGEELKAFNVRDGYGIRCALTSGIEVAIITGRKAKLVEDRCETLGITHLYQGQSDKMAAFKDLLGKLAIAPENVAYVGDDLIDWPVMAEVGLSIAVADAHPLLLPRADYVTHINGGRGAVREVCDLLGDRLARDRPRRRWLRSGQLVRQWIALKQRQRVLSRLAHLVFKRRRLRRKNQSNHGRFVSA